MSALETMSRLGFPERCDREAALTAMSLCAMGGAILQGKPDKKCRDPVEISPSPSFADIANSNMNVVDGDSLQTSTCIGNSFHQRRNSGKLPPKKRFNKLKESKRDRVPLEEMKRLMRVYGPTKCLRNRTPKELGKRTEILSVKRKFYRWFPDFQERFELQAPGDWYKPKIGHAEEMKYREELRKLDQRLLTMKRNAKKIRKEDPTLQS